jgi:hypothetical protein
MISLLREMEATKSAQCLNTKDLIEDIRNKS